MLQKHPLLEMPPSWQLRSQLSELQEARTAALRDAAAARAEAAIREARATELEAHCEALEARCKRAESHAMREAEQLGQDLFAQERESLRAVETEIRSREARLLASQALLAAELFGYFVLMPALAMRPAEKQEEAEGGVRTSKVLV